jgi:hypothetical protein
MENSETSSTIFVDPLANLNLNTDEEANQSVPEAEEGELSEMRE